MQNNHHAKYITTVKTIMAYRPVYRYLCNATCWDVARIQMRYLVTVLVEEHHLLNKVSNLINYILRSKVGRLGGLDDYTSQYNTFINPRFFMNLVINSARLWENNNRRCDITSIDTCVSITSWDQKSSRRMIGGVIKPQDRETGIYQYVTIEPGPRANVIIKTLYL